MAHLSDRNADRCSARHGGVIMRAYLQHAYGRAISSHTFGYQSRISLRSCGLRLLLVRNGTTRNPEQCTVLGSGSAPKRAHPGMTRSSRSRRCECIPIPAPRTALILLASCPVRGASRGDPEVGQSESWPEGQPEGRCGARGCVSQTQTRGALGNRPCPIRGAAFNGWTRQVKGGRKPAWMASLLAPALGSQVPRSRKSPRWSVRKALFYYQGASFGAPSPLKKGRSTESPTRAAAREREAMAV
jgi:hypothetical protein